MHRSACVTVAAGLLAVAALLATGCGQDQRQGLAPVVGRVTVAGEPLEEGQIVFSNPGGRSAIGRIEQGEIVQVTTRVQGDGAPVGSYSVGIANYPQAGMYAPPAVSRIRVPYANPQTSGLTVDIKAGQTNELHFDLSK